MGDVVYFWGCSVEALSVRILAYMGIKEHFSALLTEDYVFTARRGGRPIRGTAAWGRCRGPSAGRSVWL